MLPPKDSDSSVLTRRQTLKVPHDLLKGQWFEAGEILGPSQSSSD